MTEDGFYALTIALNIGLGRGVTTDGETLTNGFQPLFVFLLAPLFTLVGGDRVGGLRWMFFLNAVVFVGAAYLLAVIARDLVSRTDQVARLTTFRAVFVLYVGSRLTFLTHFNGLETGCLLFFILLTLVAAGQTGTLGYFRDHVVNVDGKVNAEALRYQDNMVAYLDREGIRWFCDLPDYTARYLGVHPEEHGWHLAARSELFLLYQRR